jgi:DNA-binding protein HU-beta
VVYREETKILAIKGYGYLKMAWLIFFAIPAEYIHRTLRRFLIMANKVRRMTKSDLIASISECAGLSKADSGRALNAMIDSLSGAMSRGESVALVGFGTFTIKSRSARSGRNPQSGAVIEIPPSRIPSFKPGKLLKDRVNGGAVKT